MTTFAIPKCPILVVCAAVVAFMSRVDPNDYFLPSILFKEKHSNSRYGSKDLINDNNNKNLRIGAQQKNDSEDTKLLLPEQAIKAATNEGTKSSNGDDDAFWEFKKQEKKQEIASISSSRKNTEVVEVVVPKDNSKKVDQSSGDNKSQSQGGNKMETPSQLRKKTAPERTGKPLFILHIGPPKTGTTTLQCELGAKFPQLLQENFHYLGFYYPPLCGLPEDHDVGGFSDATRAVLLHCYSDHALEGCDLDNDLEEQWREFEKILLSHKEHNVIMSDEMFHHHFEEKDVKRMAKILNPHWDVRILYTYRHFYSFVPSLYQQVNDPYAIEPGMAFAHEKTIWPSEGGYKIVSFRDGNHFKVDAEMTRFNLWTDSFNWVQVFNMENTKGDYLPDFICTMIPESKVLCQDAKKEDASKHKDNDSSSKFLHFDMLAVEAHEQGLLKNTKKTRPQVRDAVQEFCKSKDWSFQHFPLDCLSQPELESFLQESLDQAHILQPYFANPRDSSEPSIDQEIVSGFQSYREKKKFCSVNTKRTLEEHPWRQFFLNLV